MSRIDRLIAKLAPSGVEFKLLGDIAGLVRGNGMPKAVLTDDGIGAVHYGQIYTRYGVWATETVSFVSPATAVKLAKVDPGDLIVTNTSENIDDVGKAVAWLGERQIVTGGHATVIKHQLEPKYLSYWFASESFDRQKRKLASGTKVIDVSAKQLEKVRIPVPPAEVQREIVRILDQFTQLEAKLEAELTARRRQYGYYLRSLISGDDSGRRAALGDVLKSVRTPAGVKRSAYGDGTMIPIVDQGQSPIAGYTDDEFFRIPEGEYIVFGDHTRAVKWVNFSFAPGADGIKVFRTSDEVIPRYAYFAFLQLDIPDRGYNRHWTVAREIEIPIPTLERQREVVRMLDEFDTVVNDLRLGLPAELAARRKQYEYYRDKLLTFEDAAL